MFCCDFATWNGVIMRRFAPLNARRAPTSRRGGPGLFRAKIWLRPLYEAIDCAEFARAVAEPSTSCSDTCDVSGSARPPIKASAATAIR